MTIWIDQPAPPALGISKPASRGWLLIRSDVCPMVTDQVLSPVFIW